MSLRQGEPRVLNLVLREAGTGRELVPLLVPNKETVRQLFARVREATKIPGPVRVFVSSDLRRELDPGSDWYVRQLELQPGDALYVCSKAVHQTVCRVCRGGPVRGTCYRMRGFPLDVCETHFATLNRTLQKLFQAIPVPTPHTHGTFTTAISTTNYARRRDWLSSLDGPYDSERGVQRALDAGGSLGASIYEGHVVWHWPAEKHSRRSQLLF